MPNVGRGGSRVSVVRPDQHDQAYDDTPLPIGDGQTISQPHVVALTIAVL